MILSDYVGVFIFFIAMVLTGGIMILVSHLFQARVQTSATDWAKPYECGLQAKALSASRYPIHYYLVSILFVIFDVETVFLIPWALVGHEFKLKEQHIFWFVEMLVFLVILLIGYAYLLVRGVFEWGREYERGERA